MRDEKEERKKQARSNKQTNKAKQHSTPKAVTFPRKNELPRVHVHVPARGNCSLNEVLPRSMLAMNAVAPRLRYIMRAL